MNKKKFTSRFEENKAYFDHMRDMKYLRERICLGFLLTISAVVLLFVFGLISFALWDGLAPYDEYETYSVGAQITHCEMVTTRYKQYPTEIQRFFSVTGDNFSAEVEVDGKTYARYKEGDWVEVEVAEMERYLFGYRDTTTEYRILGDMIKD